MLSQQQFVQQILARRVVGADEDVLDWATQGHSVPNAPAAEQEEDEETTHQTHAHPHRKAEDRS